MIILGTFDFTRGNPVPAAMSETWLAVLGRHDYPTDAVQQFCIYLARALQPNGVLLEIEHVAWVESGWRRAAARLVERASKSEANWLLVQYTALAWSRRGFPLRLLQLLSALKNSGSRIAVVFHDVLPFSGTRLVDRLRRSLQVYVMRRLVALADLAILTVPPEKAAWLRAASVRTVFIPVAANLANPERAQLLSNSTSARTPTVAVFTVTSGLRCHHEVEEIAEAVRYAAQHIGRVNLVVFGRGSEDAENPLREQLRGADIELKVHGLCDADRVVQLLSEADVLLFVRGAISTRRGSALAGIACGLPVVAREGAETDSLISEAGVVLVPAHERHGYGPALLRVLTEPGYREELAGRSRRAQDRYFSWTRIAEAYAKALAVKRG